MDSSLRVICGLSVCVLLFACSGSTDSGGAGGDASSPDGTGSSSGGGDGSTPDGGGGSDGSGDGGSMDSGGGGDDSPSDAPTTQADASFGCMDPSTCASAMPVCCGTIPLTGGTIPNCTQGQISSACDTSAHCPTNIGLSCTGTQTVRLCKTSADCTEPSYNMCCTFGQSGGSLSFCANGVIAGGGGGTCH